MAKGSEQPEIAAINSSTYLIGIHNGVTVKIPASIIGNYDVDFVALNGAPTSFDGAAGKILKVKQDETGMEFASTNFTGLADTQGSYNGQANKYVVVNSNESGLIFSSTGGEGATELVPSLIIMSYKQFGGF